MTTAQKHSPDPNLEYSCEQRGAGGEELSDIYNKLLLQHSLNDVV